MNLTASLKWVGTAAGIMGATLVAANIPASGWGFVLFLTSSTCWTKAAMRMNEPSLVLLNLTFTAINILGIYRWLVA